MKLVKRIANLFPPKHSRLRSAGGLRGAKQEREAIVARSSWLAASLSSTTVSASLTRTIDVNYKNLDQFVGHAKA